MLMIVVLSVISDVTRKVTNRLIGSRPFAKYVAPSMNMEGVVMSLVSTTLASYCFYLLSLGPYASFVLPIDMNSYIIFG